MKLNLNKYFIKKNIQRPLIIAEVSANHCGKKSIFLKSITSAAKNGADLIKIQTYEPKDITVNKNFNLKNWNKKKFGNFIPKHKLPILGTKILLNLQKN